MSRAFSLGTLLSVVANQFGADGASVTIGFEGDSLRIDLHVAESAVRLGDVDAVLVDDVAIAVSGVTEEELLSPRKSSDARASLPPHQGSETTAVPAFSLPRVEGGERSSPPASVPTPEGEARASGADAEPRPSLMDKLHVDVQHLAVRISRDWLNGVIQKGPFLRGTPIDEVALVFNERNRNHLVVRGKAKGLPFEMTLLIGVENNLVRVAVHDVRVLGFLPVPAWLRNALTNLVNVADKVNRPGVAFKDGVTTVDVIKLAPMNLKMRLKRLETSGRYILFECGNV